jgi:hypothetical protein
MTAQAIREAALLLFVAVVIFISGAGFGAVVARALPMVSSVEVECAVVWGGTHE